jgi:hypothetical protein
MVGEEIPEGQAILAGLLADAHELFRDCMDMCEDATDCGTDDGGKSYGEDELKSPRK